MDRENFMPMDGVLEGRSRDVLVETLRRFVHGGVGESGLPFGADKGSCEEVLHSAAREGVAPIVWKGMLEGPRGLLAGELRSEIRNDQMRLRLWNHTQSMELVRITSSLQDACVDCLAFKGPILATSVYAETDRQFSDLDLLIGPGALLDALRVFGDLGYLVSTRHPHEMHLWHPARKIAVDVHWSLAPAYFGVRLPFEDLWLRHGIARICGADVTAPGDQDLILMLSIQAAKDLSQRRLRLINLLDIALLVVTRGELNPAHLGIVAKDANARRMLCFGLLAAAEVFRLPRVRSFANETGCEPDKPTRIALEQVSSRFCGTPGPFVRKAVYLGSETWPDSLREAAPLAFATSRLLRKLWQPTDRDRSMIELPAGWRWLYPLVRPIRLGVDLVRRPSGLLSSVKRTLAGFRKI